MSELLIYKASAGSGKTYRLTRNYLLMLYKNPGIYRNILAVTFTNKAAGEMKARILESLYKLASADPAVDGYRADLVRETGRTIEEINKIGRDILTTILNDYSGFYVSTIDKFFQTVIRGFTREIGLQSGYNLELNGERILTEAVDRLMAGLDTTGWLRTWLVSFADERILAGKSWDPNKDIFNLGTEVFREEYREIFDSPVLADGFGERISSYSAKLAGIMGSMDEHLKKTGRSALEIIRVAGLEINDFSNKSSGVAGYFVHLAEKGMVEPGKRVLAALEDPAKWYASASPMRDAIERVVEQQLSKLLKHAVGYYNENLLRYNTASAIYRNIHAFGILNHISLRIREIVHEKNIFLLSDATYFLKKIIEGNPTPFVYEKAGNYFSHFMLDEFQDTSGFQWQNFAPLIENALAQGRSNLIVGDVKQSIYRWRNSDWMILAAEVEKHFNKFSVDVEPLKENWRSHENIVSFNNTLFLKSAEIIASMVKMDALESGAGADFTEGWPELISGIYGDTVQSVPEKFRGTGGYVTAQFHENKSNDAYLLWLKEQLPAKIKDLQDRGYDASDITILVRKGSEGREIASLLLAAGTETNEGYNFNVISNDSLYLTSNPAVNFLVALLNFMKNPADQINLGFIKHEFIRYLENDLELLPDLNSLFMNLTESRDFHRVFGRFYEEFPTIQFLPLYELSEQLISIFELNTNIDNLPYIQAFQDMVLDFVRNETTDINAFLEYWEKSGQAATLGISEAQDAIRIMTIHKAKGLQFRVVIVPYCHWSLTTETGGIRDNILWCNTEATGFDEIPWVPVRYNKELLNSAFRDNYLNEKFHSYIDNLNLLYVAFTRTVEELHIMAGKEVSGSRPAHTGSLLSNILEKDFPGADFKENPEGKQNHFAFGLPHQYSEDREKKFRNAHEQSGLLDTYPVTRTGERLKLNIRNAYLSEIQEDTSLAIGYGTVMHEILSGIRSRDDLNSSVEKAFSKGKITAKQKSEITELLEKSLGSGKTAVWFDGFLAVKTEQDLTYLGRGILRPDRVIYFEDHIEVVDYKFGEKTEERHTKQVREYMKAIGEIEHRKIKGFVWYISLGRIVEVQQ